jgi:hypothetical protein
VRKTLATINLLAGTTLTVMAAYQTLKAAIRTIAETETVQTEAHYVVVKAARGHYNKPGGFKMMKSDYEFFKIISNFHNE